MPLTAKHMRPAQDSSFGILFALNYKRERGMEAKLAGVKAYPHSASNGRTEHVERKQGNT
jgi:hypothetical protein